MRKKTYETPQIEENDLYLQEEILQTSTVGLEDYNKPDGGWNWGN